MSWLCKISLKNGVAIVVLCILVLGYGFYSATQIKKQTFPDIEFPAIFVQAMNPGASTEEIESEITKPIEDSLKSIKNYDSLTSTSSENAATISIQFPFGSDMEKLTGGVQAAIDSLNLPENVKISVQRLSLSSAPIYQAAIFAKDGKGTTELSEKLQNEIVPKLQNLEGVSIVTLKGTQKLSL